MEFSLEAITQQAFIQSTVNELKECNEMTYPFNLVLSENDMEEIAQARIDSLKNNGRIEFNGGILKKLIYAFCDSPFISQTDYAETIAALQDSFYYFKNESMDILSDDELIEYMKIVFNTRAQGSWEYLSGTSLEELCRYVREMDSGEGTLPIGDIF